MANPPVSDAQQVPPPTGGNTSASNMTKAMATSQGTVVIPLTTNATVIPPNTNASTILSNTQNEPFTMSVASQIPPITPRPSINGVSRTYASGFTIPTSVQIYGILKPPWSNCNLDVMKHQRSRHRTSFIPPRGKGKHRENLERDKSRSFDREIG